MNNDINMLIFKDKEILLPTRAEELMKIKPLYLFVCHSSKFRNLHFQKRGNINKEKHINKTLTLFNSRQYMHGF